MKTYEIELKYTSYTSYTIEAETQEKAEELAFEEAAASKPYGSWDIDSIEELTPEVET